MKEETLKTIDGVLVNDEDVVWVAALDMDSYNYIPQDITIKRCKTFNQTLFWSTEELAQKECDKLNSL